MVTGSFSLNVIVALSVSFATLTAPYCKSTPVAPFTEIAPAPVVMLDAACANIVVAPELSTLNTPASILTIEAAFSFASMCTAMSLI